MAWNWFVREPKPAELRAAAHRLGISDPEMVRKDVAVIDALKLAFAAHLPEGAKLVFSGGTCLARAHKMVRRMSEDADLKIAIADTSLSRSAIKQKLSGAKKAIGNSLLEGGFEFTNEAGAIAKNENRLVEFQLNYGRTGNKNAVIRDYLKVEMVFCEVRLPTQSKSIQSLLHEVAGRPPELVDIECISVTETAAEKLISLTRRVAGAIEGTKPEVTDRFIVRHIYDLHAIAKSSDFDGATTVKLGRAIAAQDADQYAAWFPGYREDPRLWTSRAINHLAASEGPRSDYEEFLAAMVYGHKTPYDDALASVRELACGLW
jgi:predicted nucleotidyltransferase component of viral defense system